MMLTLRGSRFSGCSRTFFALRRAYATSRDDQKGIPIASFPIETYVNTNGIAWNKVLQPTLRDIGWLDAPEIDSAKTLDHDSASLVRMSSAPLGHVEDAGAAARRKVNYFYRCEGPLLGEPMSVWTLKFFPLMSPLSLEEYVEERMKTFFLTFPNGSISSLTLHPSVLGPISRSGATSTSTHYFHKKTRFVCGEESGLAQFGQMSLFLRTQEGVWDLSWHAVASLLKKRKELFVGGVKLLSVSPSSAPELGVKQRSTTAVPLPTPDL